jgi:uncharacterized membrane protein HdeD (DUF308 family)
MERQDRPLGVGEGIIGLAAETVSRSWWMLALRGLLGVIVGLMALARPATTLMAFLMVAGAYLIVDGVFTLFAGLRRVSSGFRFWPFLIEGTLSVIVGVLAFRRPEAFALGVLMLVALRCIVTGGTEIAVGSAVSRATGVKEWALWIAGASSVLFGVLLLISPGVGIATLLWMGGIYAIIFGVALTGSAFRLRSWAHDHQLLGHA